MASLDGYNIAETSSCDMQKNPWHLQIGDESVCLNDKVEQE